ncbi:MAG: type VI secretion system baseplate subunit TssE [Acetobacteraceae bacterium]|nr:type VI secretion system baseplate subunit TssE [Acetobacteraceae bacterium]
MSGRGGPASQANAVRVQLPLLERLIDEAPDRERDPPMAAAEAMQALRQSVRRELEALLNARRRWRSPPPELTELAGSPLGFGIPDFAAGVFNNQGERNRLRVEVEATIRRFEPRFLSVRVHLIDEEQRLDAALRLRIEAVLHADPAPEQVTFDTIIDTVNDNVRVRANESA